MQNMGSMMGDPSMAAPPTPMGGGEAPMDPAMAGQMSPPATPEGEMGMGSMMPPQEEAPVEEDLGWIDFALSQLNLAKKLNKSKKGRELLDKIGGEVVRG